MISRAGAASRYEHVAGSGRSRSVFAVLGRHAWRGGVVLLVGMLVLAALLLTAFTPFASGAAAAAPSTNVSNLYLQGSGHAEKPAFPALGEAKFKGHPLVPGSRLSPQSMRSMQSVVSALGTGTISGRVTTSTGTGIEGVAVEALSEDLDPLDYTFTDSAGNYVITDLPNVVVYVVTYNELGYIDEWYDNIMVPGNWDAFGATTLDLGSAATRTNIDFALALGQSISGTVKNSSGIGLVDIEVDAYQPDGTPYGFAYTTDTSGVYHITGLPAGQYYVGTSNDAGYIDEWYNDIPVPGNWDPVEAEATKVNVTSGNATSINFALATGKSISGTVKNASGTGLANVEVTAFAPDGSVYGDTYTTDTSGVYHMTGLPAGQYYVGTYNGAGYIDEWYNNIPMPGNYDPVAAGAIKVNVTSGNATSINFALATGKSISGTVENSSGTGLVDVGVDASGSDGSYYGFAVTDDSGVYHITGLPTGQYYVGTSNGAGYIDEWYNDIPLPGNDDPVAAGATPVNVTSADLTGIDFQLALGRSISGTVADAGGAPLADVQVTAQTASGDYGAGAMTDEAGKYEVAGLPSGEYLVSTINDQGYVDEWSDGQTIPGHLDGSDVTPVDVSVTDATGIDFALEHGYSISGNVTDSQTGQALVSPGLTIEIYDGGGALYGGGWAGGEAGTAYTTWALPPGTYYARTTDYLGGSSYIEEWFDNLPTSQYSRADATPIVVTGADVTGIDFALDHLNRYEQTDPYIEHSGNWGLPIPRAQASGGSYDRALTAGASATIYFDGSRLDWIAMKGTTTGKADVYVDGVLKDTVDLSWPSATYDVKVWSTGNLPTGLHKVEIIRNTNNPVDKYITLDAVDVQGTLVPAPPTITSLNPSFGSTSGGTTVTINGTSFTGLSGPSAVTFDGIDATNYTVNSGTKITAVAPAHAEGSVQVQVTAAGGTTADTVNDDFTYATAPPVTRYDQFKNPNIVKTGTWTDYTSPGSYLGSYGRSATSGASATIWFIGTRLDYIAMKGTTTGYADIYVDGVKVTGTSPVNLAASPAVYQQNVWNTGTLSNGLHSVKIVRSASSPAGKYVTLDAVDIYGTIVPPPTRYQQTDTHIVKSAGWSDFTSTSASGGSYGRSLTSGASATITFNSINATRLDWIAMKGTTTGYADVWLDGVKVTSTPINLTAASATYQVVVWSSGTLSSGVHTVQIVRNDSLSGTTKYVTLDAVDIWGTIQ